MTPPLCQSGRAHRARCHDRIHIITYKRSAVGRPYGRPAATQHAATHEQQHSIHTMPPMIGPVVFGICIKQQLYWQRCAAALGRGHSDASAKSEFQWSAAAGISSSLLWGNVCILIRSACDVRPSARSHHGDLQLSRPLGSRLCIPDTAWACVHPQRFPFLTCQRLVFQRDRPVCRACSASARATKPRLLTWKTARVSVLNRHGDRITLVVAFGHGSCGHCSPVSRLVLCGLPFGSGDVLFIMVVA